MFTRRARSSVWRCCWYTSRSSLSMAVSRAARGKRPGRQVIYVLPAGASAPASGTWYSALARPLADDAGEVVAGVCTFRDITQAKRIERERAEGERKLESRL